MIDVNSLVLGEVAKVEELSGLSIGRLGEDEAPKGLMMAALAFVWKRRSEPAFTWNQALALTLDEANAILGIEDDEDAAPAKGCTIVDHRGEPYGRVADLTFSRGPDRGLMG